MSLELRAVLAGQMPSGKNQIGTQVIGGQLHRFPQARFEKWRGSAYAQLDRQRGAWAKLTTPARIEIRYWPGDLLKRDVPGVEDALAHLLEWCPIHGKNKRLKPHCPLPFVADDALIESWAFERMPLDRVRPRLELALRPL